MELFQEILVFITFFIALGYLMVKFLWTPPFLRPKKTEKSCGVSGCSSC